MSDILYLNGGQKKILESFIKLQNKSEYHEAGISGYVLKKEGLVSLSTWQDNYRDLVQRQLITEVQRIESKKKKNSQRRTKEKFTFKITPLGFIAYLKNLEEITLNFNDRVNAPPYYMVLENLLKLDGLRNAMGGEYKQLLGIILQNSIQCFSLSYLSEEFPSKLNLAFGNPIEESMRLDFYEFSLTLRTTYNTLSSKQLEYLRQKRPTHLKTISLTVDNYNLIQNNIYEKIRFVYYFNLIRLAYDPVYFFKMYCEAYDVSQQQINESGEDFSKVLSKQMDDVASRQKKFSTMGQKIVILIKNDDDFKNQFTQSLQRTAKHFELPKILSDLRQQISLTQ